ncbi:MAG: hypothetical protein K0Q95_105 [Bacteroidota bacterium]|jgi:hypothetical protein|nr:hypothetical protein [Bacteroidota bacterium]
MKKSFLIACTALFLCSFLFACKSHGPNCQAYSKVIKVKADKTEKSI